MKPEEIKKALDKYIEQAKNNHDNYIAEDLQNTLDLINQYEADKKELKYKVKKWKENYECQQYVLGDFREIINKQAEELKTAKAEARKEFVKELQEKYPITENSAFSINPYALHTFLDNLLKEMGVSNES